MLAYIARRLLFIIPTLLAIITTNFFIVQIAPGGPVDQAVAEMSGVDSNMVMERISGQGRRETGDTSEGGEKRSAYRGARGLDPEVIEEINKRFGFDKPIHVRYFEMLRRYLAFDFGDSLFRGRSVVGLIADRMPVSISLGLWSTLIIYLVSIPLGVRKAVRNGSRFDLWTSTVIILGSAIPTFLFAVLLVILFAGGSFLKIFPLRGLTSVNFQDLSYIGKVLDYAGHLVLPVTAMTIGGFATLSMLTKNSFLDEINKQYVMTARAKGLAEKAILFKHVFRNAMLLIIAGFPAAFISMFFTGSLFIEVIFSLEGLGLLGFEATMQRDYPVMFGTLYMFTLLGLLLGLVSDLMYTVIDPRIDFEGRK
ncbi:MAG: microcin ABC transporter permease [Treponema sp. GWB1_62_6]|nr:MAG: microcin ABC transporter permease [Treponema sp. GWA1_62_8]OHE64875.1 MAG: microcin ABC transporter permease [Treponema sp. GWC1_61_84]OHE65023.1 MAG: microcin ABC transporter permease [Treponema sp. GWB1_62_6]OHE76171.1 MAG: microcin ABC transporter permease [Treponema sp. RIFOXYC1_FULL_61_9]HCM28139.1 microcin ABC transporter permease [Treponema sp.]